MLEFAKPKTEFKTTINPIILFQIAAFVLGLFFLYQIKSILVLIFLAFVVMVALNPSVNKLQQKTKLPRLLSILVVYVFFVIAVVGATGLLIPPLVTQFIQLLKLIDAPFIQNHLVELKLSVGDLGNLVNQFGQPANFIFSALTSTVSTLFTFFTLLVLSFYLILEREGLHRKIVWLTKKEAHIQLAKEFLNSIEAQLGGWVRGELILMVIIGAMSFVGLTLLGIPYAVPLAIFAGLLEALPSIGPTVSAVPAIAIAVLQVSPWHGAAVLVLYIIVQQLENNLLVPKVMQDNAHISPLASIISILIGFRLGGMMGGLLAVPIYIVIRTGITLWHKVKANSSDLT
ncbi:MAG TPA: hypothetical protein DEP87_01120 [Candidatus Pacebacteria bacterium]|nr:hypothetical protein [Candidatus Paceibacterota bacterium]